MKKMETGKGEKKPKTKLRKEARRFGRRTGAAVFIFLFVFSLMQQLVLTPIISKIWGLTLATTPDGFISNANFGRTILKSPWIIVVGLALLFVLSFIYMWQTCGVFLAIGYSYKNESFSVFELLKTSLLELINLIRPKNWMILVFVLIVTPLANVFQTTEAIRAFAIPEYIDDFIQSKWGLFLLKIILFMALTRLFLRWLFLLPSFFLKHRDFKKASEESFTLTKKGYRKNGILLVIYNLVENVRLAIVPAIIIMGSVGIVYFFTREYKLSSDFIMRIGVEFGYDFVKSISSTLVYISTIGYLFLTYIKKLEEMGLDTDFQLPEIKKHAQKEHSVLWIQVIMSVASVAIILIIYLSVLFLAQVDESAVLDIFGKVNVVAHKGYSSQAPENTMPAFELADKSDSVDFIELDVWNSKDGIPVVVHNESIAAATGIDKMVYEYTYEELQKIPATYKMDATEYADARIPSLEEVLKTYADSTPILIEIKGYKQDPTLVNRIVDLMDKYNCKETCMIHSGDYNALKAVKEIDPNIECGLIQAIVAGNVYDLPYVDFFSVEHNFVTPNLVYQLHKRNKKIYVWTVNYSSSAAKFSFISVDGLITDYPDKINEYVASNNMILEDALTDLVNDALDGPEIPNTDLSNMDY